MIRAFAELDRETVIALWEHCGLVVAWNDPDRDIGRKLAHSPEQFLVLEDAGRVVATAMFGYDGHRGSVNYLAVDPGVRGTGLAQELMAEIEQRLTALDCPKINIMVRNSNLSVQEFYQHLGYSTDEVAVLGKRLISDQG